MAFLNLGELALKPIGHEAIRNAIRSDRHRPVHARWLDMRIEDFQDMGRSFHSWMHARGHSVHASLAEFAIRLGQEFAIVNFSAIAHLDLV